MNTNNKTTSLLEDVKIKLSAIWVALMLTYLLGDVMRIFSGDFEVGEIVGMQATQGMFLGMAVLFVIPILMIYLSLTLNNPVNGKHLSSHHLFYY